MLLIFDLDDTLIDTTSQITAMKLKNALRAMIESGLPVKSYAAAEEMLLRMNQGARSTRDALIEFVELFHGNRVHFNVAIAEIQKVDLDKYDLRPDEDIIELLEEFKKDHMLALVTRGSEEMQREKLRVFGLSESLFCEIVVTPYHDKGQHYLAICSKHGIPPHEVIVVGDRIEGDLKDAKKMGARTVHMKKGRGANCQAQKEIVDFTIYDLSEFVSILENQEKLLEIV